MLKEEQITEMSLILSNNEKVLDFKSMLTVSKPLSLLTFIFKELIDFNLKKTNNGLFLVKFRQEKIKIFKMMQEKEKINCLLYK